MFEIIITLLFVMVNFTCQVDWVRDTQIAGKTFLSVSVRTFLEEISI